MTDLVSIVRQFLVLHCQPSQPLLLALSGGPDSLSLFHCLLACQRQLCCSFHIAHVDHGWREESEQEAAHLEALASLHKIPFYSKRLDPNQLKGNLEAACREERYRFFKALCQEKGLQGVLLGHHGDDQAETILKRLFEGSHWSKLSALAPISNWNGLCLLRPFLSISKKNILDWIDKRGLTAFQDKTNADVRFLRARMRETILPRLSQEFGKAIEGPLRTLGEEIQELKKYFDKKIEFALKQTVEGPFGVYLDARPFCLEKVEIGYLLRAFFEARKTSLSKRQINESVEWVMTGAANRQINSGHRTIWIDRGRIFLLIQEGVDFQGPVSVVPGYRTVGKWKVEVEKTTDPLRFPNASWQEGWKGEFKATLPLADYRLDLALPNAPCRSKASAINKWWTAHKTPAFFRQLIPVVWKDKTIYHEFLTGRYLKETSTDQNWVAIKLSFPL